MSVRGGSGVVALSSVRASFSTCACFLEEEQVLSSDGRGLFCFPSPPPSHARVLMLSTPVSCMQRSALLFFAMTFPRLISSPPRAAPRRVRPSSAALPVPPSVAHFQLRGAASYHPRQQHATSTSWYMGSSSSVDAMLTCPRPLLCCCSWPSGCVCGLGLPRFLYPVYQPVCVYSVMRRGALEHTCLPHCCMPGAVWSADAGGKWQGGFQR